MNSITREQIDAILLGIEDGLTIEQCIKYILKIDREQFYHYATPEQKDEVKTHKMLHVTLGADYQRSFIRTKKNKDI